MNYPKIVEWSSGSESTLEMYSSLTLGPYKRSKEEGFHRRQREGRHFNNGAEWGDEAANIISGIVMEHTYENRY
jgi:hypothetical protein